MARDKGFWPFGAAPVGGHAQEHNGRHLLAKIVFPPDPHYA